MDADEEMRMDLDNVNGDAFMLLGSGLLAYRKMLGSLSMSFILMSLFMVPIILSYGKGTGLEGVSLGSPLSIYTIANLGYSSV